MLLECRTALFLPSTVNMIAACLPDSGRRDASAVYMYDMCLKWGGLHRGPG